MHAKVLATILVALVAGAGATRASAGPIIWADWQNRTVGTSGSADGTLGGIALSYTGEVSGPTQVAPGGTNYYLPATTWQSATVDNAPTCCDIIAMDLASATRTISFATPVTNPLMAIVSLGRAQLPVFYTFDAPFDILSQGPGLWGGGTLTEIPVNQLRGAEGNGVIQFQGTFSSISWTSTPSEYWHGFTVGTAQVPEPASLLLLGLGLSAAALRRRHVA